MSSNLAIRAFQGAATRRDDRLAIVPDAAAEPVAARILPDVLSEAHQMPLMRGELPKDRPGSAPARQRHERDVVSRGQTRGLCRPAPERIAEAMAPTLPNWLISESVCTWRMEGSSLHQGSLVNSYRSSIDGSPWRSIFRRLRGRLLSSERCIISHTVRVFRDPATKMPHARRIVSRGVVRL
jgi:hypothetical protein